jgi:hypothetical protein
MSKRTLFFKPVIALTIENEVATKLEWDWADSYSHTIIDNNDGSLTEREEDEDGCFLMDDFIINNQEDLRWV